MVGVLTFPDIPMLDAETGILCGAQRYERSPNGWIPGPVAMIKNRTPSKGEVNLKKPKLRKQTFETATIERYRRRGTSIEECLIEMYLTGVSVRRVEDITEAPWGTRVSSGTVSDESTEATGLGALDHRFTAKSLPNKERKSLSTTPLYGHSRL